MCGIVGISSNENIINELFSSLYSLKNRGQDSFGLSFYKNNKITTIKKNDNIIKYDRFTKKNINSNIAIAHTRYKTQGSLNLTDIQPIGNENISIIHNGNIYNSNELEKYLKKNNIDLKTKNDAEVILQLFLLKLKKKDLSNNNIFKSINFAQKKLKGAYSVLILLKDILIAFKDIYGVRPLCMGYKNNNIAFSSEDIAISKQGYKNIEELKASQIVIIKNNKVYKKAFYNEKNRFCALEYIYFANKGSSIYNKLVEDERIKMGVEIAKIFKEKNIDLDYIIPIPNSGLSAALGLFKILNKEVLTIFRRKKKSSRSFIESNQKKRKDTIENKFLIDFKQLEIIKNKKIILLDDSIVRGNTIKYFIKILKKYTKNIYVLSASPMVKSKCKYGIDIASKKELISYKNNIKNIEEELDIDLLLYLPLQKLEKMYDDLGICTKCFKFGD